MRSKWPVLIAGSLLWSGIFIAAKFPPGENELLLRYAGWSKYAAVAMPDNFAREVPFPIPTALLSLFYWTVPTELFLFRLPNLIFGVGWLAIMTFLAPAGFGIFAAASLGVIWVVMSDLPMAITMFLTAAIMAVELKNSNEKRKLIYLGFMNLWLAFTSLSGWIFCLTFAGYKLYRKDGKSFLILGLILIYVYITAVSGFINLPGFESALKFKRDWGAEVNQRVRYETKLNNYLEPVPLKIKRLVYNKPYFMWREITRRIGETLSIEKFAFPGQSEATVARSLWGSKGLALIYFWQIPLAFSGLIFLRKFNREMRLVTVIFGSWGVAGIIVGNSNDWAANGTGLIIALLWIVSLVFSQIKLWPKIAIMTLVTASAVPSFYHFLQYEEIWRDNRPKAQLVMAQMITKYQSPPAGRQGSKVTTILGRSFLYYGWINKIPPDKFWRGIQVGMTINGVKFDHFERPDQPGTYVGLPGEFLGNRAKDNKNEFNPKELPTDWQLLDTYKIRDTVSFGNGDYLWTVGIPSQ